MNNCRPTTFPSIIQTYAYDHIRKYQNEFTYVICKKKEEVGIKLGL